MIRCGVGKWNGRNTFALLLDLRSVITQPQPRHRHSFIKLRMESNSEAHLRIRNTEQFDLLFMYYVPQLHRSKHFNFTRNLSEPVGTFLSRLSIKINGALESKQKKSKTKVTLPKPKLDAVSLSLKRNDVTVCEDILCKDLFEEDCSLILQIDDQKYKIFKNHPWVQNIALPKSMMVGYPVYPVKFESYYTNEEDSEFSWHRVLPDRDECVASGIVYIPVVSDVGQKLKLVCTPKRKEITGIPVEVLSKCTVEAGPGFCPFETRHEFTKSAVVGDSVVSYNILADTYASSETGKHELFSYCPPYALCLDYRKQLITKELIGYNADIVCLQEVDCRMFEVDLKRCLKSVGLEGEFAKKGGQVNEGVACFYRKSRFKLIMSKRLTLGEDTCRLPYLSHIWDAVSENHSLCTKLKERTTALQILLFEFLDKPHRKLIVANTHLYFHPDADHIRLIQAGICLGYVNNLLNELKREDVDCEISTVFNGDFNSTPDCGVYKLFTSSEVSECYHEWKCSNEIENVSGLSLHNPIPFQSACGTPEFTNFTPHFSGCLDYIFYQCDNLTVKQVIPFPLKEDVVKHVAIPSVVFPSDHVALVADLAWK